MINKAIELVEGRLKVLTDFGTRAKGLEVVKQGPGPDLILGRQEMTVKVASGRQAAVKRVKQAVNHIAGTMSMGVVKSEYKAVSFGTEFQDGRESGASHLLLSPGLKSMNLPIEVITVVGVIDVPHPLLDVREKLLEMLAA